jgi:hypothetical protein
LEIASYRGENDSEDASIKRFVGAKARALCVACAPNARFDVLDTLTLKPPTPSEVTALREAARKETASRAEAYRTPMTEETLRRNIR